MRSRHSVFVLVLAVAVVFLSRQPVDSQPEQIQTTAEVIPQHSVDPTPALAVVDWFYHLNTTTSTTIHRHHTTTTTTHYSTTHYAGSWDDVANCESGGHWDDTRAGFEGGVHFMNSTWLANGGGKYAQHAYNATKDQQIEIANIVLKRYGWHSQWPICGKHLGLP